MKRKTAAAVQIAWCVLTLLALSIPATAQSLPAEVCQSLHAARNAITHDPLTPAELAGVLDVTAATHRADGWGLSGKPNGNHCPRSDGALVACDILQRGMLIWDVLAAAGDPGGSYVTCGDSMPAPTSTDRPWVAPLGPVPTPTPTPTPTPLPSVDLSPILAAIGQTRAELQVLEAKVTAMAASLEEHRAEARKMKAWAKDWKSWAGVLGGVLAGWLAR